MHFLQLVLYVLVIRAVAVQLQHKQGNMAAAGRALESAVRQRQYAMWSANLRPNMSLLETGSIQSGATVESLELRSLAGLTGKALGLAASMSESGYRAVARAKSRVAMRNYIERVLEKEDLVLTKSSDLEGVLPYYDGECAKQSFSNLVAELRRGTVKHGCREPWIAHKNGAALLQIEASQHRDSKDLQGVPSAGALAPLNEKGYQAVASTKSNKEMIAFIKRVMLRDGLRVQNAYGLNGFVPYYSGECATQSFDALVTELHHAAPAPVAEATLPTTSREPPTSVAARGTLKFKQQAGAKQLRKAIPTAANVDKSLIVIQGVAPQETNLSANATSKIFDFSRYNKRLIAQDNYPSANAASQDVNASKHVALDKERRMRKKLVLNQILVRRSEESTREVLAEKHLRDDLEGLKLKALKDLAREEGVTEKQIEDADDTDNPVESMMDCIVQGRKARAQEVEAEKHFRDGLDGLKLKALKELAREEGVTEKQIENVDDTDNPLESMIDCIVQGRKAKAHQAPLDVSTDTEKHKVPSGFVQGACGSGWVA